VFQILLSAMVESVKFQSCHVPKAVFGVQVVLNNGLQEEKV